MEKLLTAYMQNPSADMHTPGPWKLVRSTVKGEFGVDYRIRDNNDSLICTIGPNSQEANANLIAAAPDNIYALAGLLSWVENHCDIEDEDLLPQVQKARAAIAKAEGK